MRGEWKIDFGVMQCKPNLYIFYGHVTLGPTKFMYKKSTHTAITRKLF